MRSPDHQRQKLYFYFSLESRVPQDHPLRPIKKMVDKAFKALDREFNKLYSPIGRPSIPPERLLKALLLQILYSIRNERALIEHLDFNILFRWFVGLPLDEAVWNHSTFSKNRDRLIDSAIALSLLDQVVRQAEEAGLLSKEHFTVDGTLLEAWASLKSFKPKDDPPSSGNKAVSGTSGRNPEVDFHGEKRSNKTHISKTDPEALLAKKARAKKQSFVSPGMC